jgi:hypothetical protein
MNRENARNFGRDVIAGGSASDKSLRLNEMELFLLSIFLTVAELRSEEPQRGRLSLRVTCCSVTIGKG